MRRYIPYTVNKMIEMLEILDFYIFYWTKLSDQVIIRLKINSTRNQHKSPNNKFVVANTDLKMFLNN